MFSLYPPITLNNISGVHDVCLVARDGLDELYLASGHYPFGSIRQVTNGIKADQLAEKNGFELLLDII